VPLLAGTTLLAVDTETMGFDVKNGHRLVEIAWIRIVDGGIVEEWSSLVNPGQPIPEGATAVHKISDEMVAGSPRPADVGKAVREALADFPLVFHNAPFDLPFLKAFFEEAGAPPLANPIVDTLGLARELFGPSGNRLGELAKKLALAPPGRPPRRSGGPDRTDHSASWDAHLTAQLLVKLAGLWEARRGPCSLAELASSSMDKMRLTARR
jgi:DNA polymerase-3 subunit epsilon